VLASRTKFQNESVLPAVASYWKLPGPWAGSTATTAASSAASKPRHYLAVEGASQPKEQWLGQVCLGLLAAEDAAVVRYYLPWARKLPIGPHSRQYGFSFWNFVLDASTSLSSVARTSTAGLTPAWEHQPSGTRRGISTEARLAASPGSLAIGCQPESRRYVRARGRAEPWRGQGQTRSAAQGRPWRSCATPGRRCRKPGAGGTAAQSTTDPIQLSVDNSGRRASTARSASTPVMRRPLVGLETRRLVDHQTPASRRWKTYPDADELFAELRRRYREVDQRSEASAAIPRRCAAVHRYHAADDRARLVDGPR